MRRSWWAAPLLAALAVVGVSALSPPEPAPSGDLGGSSVVAGLLGGPSSQEVEDWRPRPAKSPTLDFVREQGGLWSTRVPQDAGGGLRTVPGSTEAPRAAERVVTVRVEVETGLGADGAEFARQVMDTLNDSRGWGHDGSVSFARTDGEADVDVTLASPATTDELCAPVATRGRVSCGRVGFAVLNAARWAGGSEPFLEAGGTVAGYRNYLVNHEVGHVLGHGHVSCPAPGTVAPVMLQQTLGLDGCLPSGWPAESP